MLDALLGHTNFYTKCKTLIKQARTRIEVVRRKRNATQKFLRKDIADLLANNLDDNAFARANGFIVELILSSCYDFIDHVCEIVLKHLSVLEKLRECPEDCREAVASLMFAAARFSDLPELRDLRDLFQERYGTSLEFYVNQKLVENINANPPSTDNKIQLLQDIALEFSVKWDSRRFQARMSSPVTEKKPRSTPETLHVNKNKIPPPPMEVAVKKKDEPIHRNVERERNARAQFGSRSNSVPDRKDDQNNNTSKKPESPSIKNKEPSYSKETIPNVEDHDISFKRTLFLAQKPDIEKKISIKEAIQIGTSSHGRRMEHVPKNNGIDFPSRDEDSHAKSLRKQQSDVTDGLKSNFRGGIPPPYVKPVQNNHKTDVDGHRQVKADSRDHRTGASAQEDGNGDGPAHFTQVYYKDERNIDFTPRKRSHRRKHSRSSSSQDIELSGEERVLQRNATSRRKHGSKKGLQIVAAADEEERIIDKLLLQYSKKPSSSEPGKSERKTNASRSVSLPSRNVTEPKEDNVITRAASFQPGTPAKHVHPKLPDYDDLAARFAALRAVKD